MTKPLTPTQVETLARLSPYAGQTVLVITSAYDANIAQRARDMAVGIGFSSTALRGLAARGILKVEPMWKGAWVTVPENISRLM